MGQTVSWPTPDSKRLAAPTADSGKACSEDFGSNAARSESITREGASFTSGIGDRLLAIHVQQAKGIDTFAEVAKQHYATPDNDVLANAAGSMLLFGLESLSSAVFGLLTGGPGGAAAGVIIGALEAGINSVCSDMVSSAQRSLQGRPEAEVIDTFALLQREALTAAAERARTKWTCDAAELDDGELEAAFLALEPLVLEAVKLQYQACIGAWAEQCGRAAAPQAGPGVQSEGFSRAYEVRVDLRMDPTDPRKEPAILGAAIPAMEGPLLDHLHMLDATLAETGLRVRICGAGFEILASPDGHVLDVRGSEEGLEQLRRVASVDPTSARPPMWEATQGEIGDDNRDLHVQNGASLILNRWVRTASLTALGLS